MSEYSISTNEFWKWVNKPKTKIIHVSYRKSGHKFNCHCLECLRRGERG